jgi:hypothetical protein
MKYISPELNQFERKDYSQFGEDGVIERIASDLEIDKGTFFEFGVRPADGITFTDELEGNFVGLRKKGWSGVFLDGFKMPLHCGVRHEFVTALNINQLYRKHCVAHDLDFLSIDVDGQDFWIWLALNYQPKVVVNEYNGGLGGSVSLTTQFDPSYIWDGSIYQGASYIAMNKLAKSKGYTTVYANGVNMISIRDDLVANKADFDAQLIFTPFLPHAPDVQNRPWVEV